MAERKEKTAGEMGFEILANFIGCSAELLNDMEKIKSILLDVAGKAGFTQVGECFYKFEPQGVTGIVLLAESHLSVHTWPEFGSAAVDIFSCAGKENAERALILLKDAFKPRRVTVHRIER